MRKFGVREFFKKDFDEWPCEKHERFICKFDDGVELEVTTPRLELSSYFWEVHAIFDKLPITSKHYLGNGPVPWSKIATLLSDIYETTYDVYGEGEFDREFLMSLLQRNMNNFYNTTIVRYKPWVRSVNSFDYSELYDHPEIVKIRAKLRPSPVIIQKCYDEAAAFLLSDKSLAKNPVLSDAKTGISKMEQLLQILICRGYTTDINDRIFTEPIMGNYYEGITDPAEAVIDSTLASKAYIWQGGPLERTQYGNRKMQFTSMRIDLMIQGDCGSNVFARIELTKGRVKGLLGKYFKHPKTGVLTAFKESMAEELMGLTLEFRSAIYCGYRDRRCVCTTCYGQLARNIPYGANIGVIASRGTQSEVSQLVLKIKHVQSLSVSDPVILSRAEREFIQNHSDQFKLKLNSRLAKDGVRLLVRGEVKDKIINASRLPVLTLEELRSNPSVAHHTQFREVIFEYKLPTGKMDRRRLSVAKGSMSSFMSYEFLEWFVEHDFRIDSDGWYRFDLSDWDFSQPFLELPRKHLSMKDFASEVEVFIRSSQESSDKHLGKLKQLAQYQDPTQAMLDLYDLISSRVSVHMTHVSIIVLSMMYDPEDPGRLRIPPITRQPLFAKYAAIMANSSFAVMAAYQTGGKELQKPEQFLATDREPHLMDPLFIF